MVEKGDSEGISRGYYRGQSRRRRFARLVVRSTLILTLLAGAAAVAGFLYFADMIATLEPPANPRADAIVVLTGGSQRIDQAVELLRSGAGKRLLISGVNPSTSGNQIRRNTQSSARLFECCVDIGHDAIDTIGNANETARWINDNGYQSVLVVTNNYHIPRSLLELRRINPGITFIPYPVVNSDLKNKNWLNDRMVLRIMVTEYAKSAVAWLRNLSGAVTGTGLRTGVAPIPALVSGG